MPSVNPLPLLVILIMTYDRYSVVKDTIKSVLDNIRYPNYKIVVSDDNTGGGYTSKLKRLSAFKDADIEFIETPERMGWGKHANWALAHIRKEHPDAEFIFHMEDDYQIDTVLDIDTGVAILKRKPEIGMMRYRGTAGSHVVLHQMPSVTIDHYVQEYQEGKGVVGEATYMLLDSNSPDLWLYSNGPHLKRADFHDFYGEYPENVSLGDCEEQMAHRVKNRMKLVNAPAIAIMPKWIPMLWDHVGDSWQRTEHDIHFTE